MRRRAKARAGARQGRRTIGLARALSKLGHCSRSAAIELIRAGRVRLNGSVARNPEAGLRLENARIEVDGARVGGQKRVYFMMNKPRGAVTTAEDERGRETVYDLLPQGVPWVGPVGRLDKASEGLLLFTNDSEWAARVTAPETHLEKTYHVQIDHMMDDSLLRSLEHGFHTKDGEILSTKEARTLRTGEKNSWIVIVLDEGKNRQIRRMLAAFGVQVLRLVRVAIGPVQLGTLAKRETRELTREEKMSLDRAMAMAAKARS